MLLGMLVATATLVALLLLLIRRFLFARQVNRIPGSCHSFLGLGLRNTYGLLRVIRAKTGAGVEEMTFRFVQALLLVSPKGIHRTWFGPLPHVLISSPEMVEPVVTSHEVLKKGMPYRFMAEVLGDGLLTGHGDKWHRHRKLLTPAFHFRVLEEFLPVIVKCSDILLEKLEQLAARNDGLIEDLHEPILNCAMDVICETAMGLSVNAQDEPDSEYVLTVNRFSNLFMERSWSPIGYFSPVYFLTRAGFEWKRLLKIVTSFTESVLRKRKADILLKIKQNGTFWVNEESRDKRHREPFIDILIRENMKNPDQMSDVDVRNEVETFMAAGHDTTGWCMVWTTYLLGLYPEIQEKVHHEIDSFYEDGGADREVTLESLKTEFPYVESVIKESLRLYPPGAINTRTTEKEVQIGSHTVPAGVQLVLCICAIHRDPRHWTDPEKFCPERFLTNQRRHPFAFMPFSAGPRNCIGQKFAILELKATLVKLFRKFHFTSLDPRDKVIPSVAFMLKPVIPVRMRLQLRSAATLVTHL